MCIARYGTDVTAKPLNSDDVESFKAIRYHHYEGVAWGKSTVAKVLRHGAVLGAYQPYITHGVDMRQKSGELELLHCNRLRRCFLSSASCDSWSAGGRR